MTILRLEARPYNFNLAIKGNITRGVKGKFMHPPPIGSVLIESGNAIYTVAHQ